MSRATQQRDLMAEDELNVAPVVFDWI